MYLFFIIGLVDFVYSFSTIEHRIKIVTASYNNRRFCKKNLLFALMQTRSNYHIIYIDDCSLDGTADLVEALLDKYNLQDKVTLIRNKRRCGAARNIYYAIHNFCDDDDIVVILDGDDWFAHERVLSVINDVYAKHDVWLTYGDWRDARGQGGYNPIGEEVIKKRTFRQHPFVYSHPKTYYAWLYKLINLQDLLYEGKFFPVAQDVAQMFPLIEMCGKRFKFIPQVLYVWNIFSPIHNHHLHGALQLQLAAFIQKKESYSELTDPIKSSDYLSLSFSSSIMVVAQDDMEKLNEILQKAFSLPFVKNIYCLHTNKYNYDGLKDHFDTVHWIQYDGELLSEVSTLLQTDERILSADVCILCNGNKVNEVLDNLGDYVKHLRRTRALVVTCVTSIAKRKFDISHATYLWDDYYTYQLGWKPILDKSYQEQAHIFSSKKLRTYTHILSHILSDSLALNFREDPDIKNEAGLIKFLK